MEIDWNNYNKNKKTTSFPLFLLEKYIKGNVLDLGCGEGVYIKRIKKINHSINAYGVDISSEIIKKAKKEASDIDFQSASVYQLPYLDNFFDLIYSIDVIEHLDNPEKMLKEVKRILKPGGIFIIQTPNYPIKRVYDFYNVVSKKNWRHSFKDDPTHIYKFNTFKLKSMCQKFFKIVDLRVRNIFLEKKISFVEKIKKKKYIISFVLGQKTIIILKK